MKKNPLFTKAFEYAVRGYSVIPIRADKIPAIASWKIYQDAPADEGQIERWWKSNPQANIGIVTGKISGITVVDIDMSDDNKFTPLSAFPKTYTVKTPTGGYHLYYKYTPDILQTANTFPQFPHVDIRNDGGYVIAPPSHCEYEKGKKIITGDYTVFDPAPIAEFPVALFVKKASKSKSANKNAVDLLKEFKGMEEGDGRNNALAKVIGRAIKLTLPKDYEEIAWPLALSLNDQFKTPLEEKEVRTIFASIAKREQQKPLADVEFIKNEKGAIICNEENVYRTIKNDEVLESHFRLNTFTGVIESDFSRTGEWISLQRSDIISTQMYLMRTYAHFTKVPHGMVEDSIMLYAQEFKVSPPVEWMQSLKWDKKKRLDTWLSTVYGVPADDYHKSVASNWMKGLVKRLVRPGCKFDYVMVLEGKQGIKKSTSLAVLGGSWHVETVFTPDNKDFFMIFGGKAIVEFSEGETLSRTEAKRLKGVITMQYDKYRPPYERSAKEFPRQCVFAMTTNQEQYLKDETGNRRWLPVACQKVADIEWLEANREQLFAEAYHRVITKNETTYEFPEDETKAQQEMRQTTDPRVEQIYDWYFYKLTQEQREKGITTREAYLCGVQGLDAGATTFGKEMGKLEEMVISTILRENLYMDKKRVMDKNVRFYKYFASEETAKMSPTDALIEAPLMQTPPPYSRTRF